MTNQWSLKQLTALAPLLAAKRPENLARLYVRDTYGRPMVLGAKHLECLTALCSPQPAYSQIIIKTLRGGGKTMLVAAACAWLQLQDQTWKINVNSGSWDQAHFLYDYYKPLVTNAELFPPELLDGEPTQGLTKFKKGGSLRILQASERQSRGPHPDIIIFDEAVLVGRDLIEAAWPSVNTSPRPKRILLSTASTTKGAVSLDWFLNIWQDAEKVGFKRYGWERSDCPWVNQEDAKRVQLLYGIDSNTWRTEFEGETAERTGRVWDGALIDAALVPFDANGEQALVKEDWPLPLGPPATEWSVGLDWGFTHPTVISVWEKQGETVFLRDLKIRVKESFTEIRQMIVTDYPKIPVYADSSSPGENEDLHRMGAHVQPVIFSEDKGELINHVRWRLENKFMKIAKIAEFEPLIHQMKSYHYDNASPPKPAKIDDDCVDSMLCGMRPWMRDTSGMFVVRGARPNR